MNPDPSPEPKNPFTEGLAGGLCVGDGLIEGAACLAVDLMGEQAAFEFKREGTGPPDPFLERGTQQVFRSHPAVEDECVSEVRINALSSPDRCAPWMGVPVRDRRKLRGAGHAEHGVACDGCRRLGLRTGIRPALLRQRTPLRWQREPGRIALERQWCVNGELLERVSCAVAAGGFGVELEIKRRTVEVQDSVDVGQHA